MMIVTQEVKPDYNDDTSMFLSLDLMIEIFVRLPVKSLVQLKSVCKNWNSYISSLEFAKLHHQHTINNPNDDNPSVDLFVSRLSNRLYPFETEKLELKETNLADKFKVNSYPIGSSNGLICFTAISRRDNVLYIQNPATHEYSYPIATKLAPLYCGFGYDPLSDDYKIVFLGRVSYQSSTPIASIFTLRTSQWRRVECPIDDEMGEMMLKEPNKSPPILLDHTLYWLVEEEFDPKYMLSFDLRTDLFEIVPIPTHNQTTKGRCVRRDFFICQLKQSLCACWVRIEVARDYRHSRLFMEVSTMERRGDGIVWKTMFKFERFISCQPGGGSILPKLFELKSEGGYLIVYTGFMVCYVIDPKTKQEHVITPKHVKNMKHLIMPEVYSLDYTQSLVSPIRHLPSRVGGKGVKRSRERRCTGGVAETRLRRKLKSNGEENVCKQAMT